MVDGTFHDIDSWHNLMNQYGMEGHTVVVHLKDDVDINSMFAKYFRTFEINDISDVSDFAD